jgi:beta-glucosidase
MPTKNLLPASVLLLCIIATTPSCHNDNGNGNTSTPTYRDLNKNGKMDVYEDSSQPIPKRVDDLLHQMTLEEKAGMLFINGARVNDDGSIEDKPGKGLFAFAPNALNQVNQKKMNHFNLWAIPSPAALAKWYNKMQHYVQDSTRLGIPITIASDPRNHFTNNAFAMSANGFSQWCEPLGLGANSPTPPGRNTWQ